MNQYREVFVRKWDLSGWTLAQPILRRVRTFVLVTIALACASASINAQVATGDILGTVADSSGAAIPDALVRLENTGTHEVRNFTTEQDGSYVFTALQPGSYILEVTSIGFNIDLLPLIGNHFHIVRDAEATAISQPGS